MRPAQDTNNIRYRIQPPCKTFFCHTSKRNIQSPILRKEYISTPPPPANQLHRPPSPRLHLSLAAYDAYLTLPATRPATRCLSSTKQREPITEPDAFWARNQKLLPPAASPSRQLCTDANAHWQPQPRFRLFAFPRLDLQPPRLSPSSIGQFLFLAFAFLFGLGTSLYAAVLLHLARWSGVGTVKWKAVSVSPSPW